MRSIFAITVVVLGSVLSLLGGVETVVIANVQVAKELGGVVVDPSGEAMPEVQVLETTPDGKTTLGSTVTDDNGKWSLPPVTGKKLYYLHFMMKNFNSVELRLKLNTKKGKPLVVTLPFAT
jgi:Carboxypeptidase regulatory-like domain